MRAADQTAERAALLQRSAKATEWAKRRSCTRALDSLKSKVDSSSHVVVALPPLVVRLLYSNRSCRYQNYEKLVESGGRVPASHRDDQQRTAVGGLLFGSYAKNIFYGVLSLNGRGPSTYGNVFLRLRNVAIEDRVSFLEMNSYQFADRFKLTAGKAIPAGYRSTWRDRMHLAAAKLYSKLKPNQTKASWPDLLLWTDGKNRSRDDFIEAHICDGLNADTVESVSFAPQKGWSREDKTDIELIKDLLK